MFLKHPGNTKNTSSVIIFLISQEDGHIAQGLEIWNQESYKLLNLLYTGLFSPPPSLAPEPACLLGQSLTYSLEHPLYPVISAVSYTLVSFCSTNQRNLQNQALCVYLSVGHCHCVQHKPKALTWNRHWGLAAENTLSKHSKSKWVSYKLKRLPAIGSRYLYPPQ